MINLKPANVIWIRDNIIAFLKASLKYGDLIQSKLMFISMQ